MKHPAIFIDPDFRKSPKGRHCHICQRSIKRRDSGAIQVWITARSNWSEIIHPDDKDEAGECQKVWIGPDCAKAAGLQLGKGYELAYIL